MTRFNWGRRRQKLYTFEEGTCGLWYRAQKAIGFQDGLNFFTWTLNKYLYSRCQTVLLFLHFLGILANSTFALENSDEGRSVLYHTVFLMPYFMQDVDDTWTWWTNPENYIMELESFSKSVWRKTIFPPHLYCWKASPFGWSGVEVRFKILWIYLLAKGGWHGKSLFLEFLNHWRKAYSPDTWKIANITQKNMYVHFCENKNTGRKAWKERIISGRWSRCSMKTFIVKKCPLKMQIMWQTVCSCFSKAASFNHLLDSMNFDPTKIILILLGIHLPKKVCHGVKRKNFEKTPWVPRQRKRRKGVVPRMKKGNIWERSSFFRSLKI